jgi:hypothetical protein
MESTALSAFDQKILGGLDLLGNDVPSFVFFKVEGQTRGEKKGKDDSDSNADKPFLIGRGFDPLRP